MENNQQFQQVVNEIDFVALAKKLWSRLWLIVMAVIVGAVAGFTCGKLSTPTYRSRASIMVNNTSSTDASGGISTGQIAVAMHLAQTYIILAESDTVLADVIHTGGFSYTVSQLRSKVSAEAIEETEIFEIYVTDTDPLQSQAIANVLVDVLPQRVQEIAKGSSLEVVDRAQLGSRVSPGATRFALVGALLGALLSMAMIVLLELFNNTISDEEYLIQTYKLPVLASVPSFDEGKSNRHYGYYTSNYRNKN